MDDLDKYRKDIVYSDDAIGRVFFQYADPVKELFDRYCKGSDDEKATMVLALLGRLMMEKLRRAG
jgi:hypothetical protein